MVRQLVPKNRGPLIIAACDQSEYAYENPKGDNGLFTAAVLEALGEAFDRADGSGTNGKADGRLDPRELFYYVRHRLPGLLADAGKPGLQHPQMFPPELALDLDRKDRNQYGYAIALRPLTAAPKGR